MANYEIIKIDEHSWQIEDEGVRCFLFEGEEMALLIDSGWYFEDLKGIVEGLTDKHVMLAVTHADVDHIHCNHQFEEIWMHPCDYSLYHDLEKGTGVLKDLWEGDIIDLGGRQFQVVHMPGHTPGSISFLDLEKRILVGGDGIQQGELYMYGPQRSLCAHVHSLERLMDEYGDCFDKIYPSHDQCPIDKDIIPKLVEGIEKVIADEVEGYPCWEGDEVVHAYDIGVAKVLYESKEHRKYL